MSSQYLLVKVPILVLFQRDTKGEPPISPFRTSPTKHTCTFDQTGDVSAPERERETDI